MVGVEQLEALVLLAEPHNRGHDRRHEQNQHTQPEQVAELKPGRPAGRSLTQK